MATASATRTLVLKSELEADAKRSQHKFVGGRTRRFYPQLLPATRSRPTLGRAFCAMMLAHRSNYRRISSYWIDNSESGSLQRMLRTGTFGSMTFILLSTHGCFGQSVRETDRSPVPSDSPLSRNSLLQITPDLVCSCHQSSQPGCEPALLGRVSSNAVTSETVGERHV